MTLLLTLLTTQLTLSPFKSTSFLINDTELVETVCLSKVPFIGPIKPITLNDTVMISSLDVYPALQSCLRVILNNKLSWSPRIKLIVSNFNSKIVLR